MPDGIIDRIAALPITPSRYRNLQSVGSKLYYVRNGSKDKGAHLLVYDLEKRKETELGSFGGFELSADGKKMLVGGGGKYAIIDLPSGSIDIKDYLSLADMTVRLDRHAEWNQIFAESWRQMRDFIYAPNMHGVDWPLRKTRYQALLPYVTTATDLSYIIGEMIGELNLGHCYVGGETIRNPNALQRDCSEPSSLATHHRATYASTGSSRDRTGTRASAHPSPISASMCREGDYILAMDGSSTREMTDLYTALIATDGKQVRLLVNGTADNRRSPDNGGRSDR